MLARHPFRAIGTVLAVMLASLFISGMIGQYNDGPWGGLPSWLGALTWFTFLGTALLLIVLSVYLAVANLRYRKTVR